MFSEQLTGVVVEGAAALAGGYLRQMACENLKCKRNAISFAALPLDIRYIFYFVFGDFIFVFRALFWLIFCYWVSTSFVQLRRL